LNVESDDSYYGNSNSKGFATILISYPRSNVRVIKESRQEASGGAQYTYFYNSQNKTLLITASEFY